MFKKIGIPVGRFLGCIFSIPLFSDHGSATQITGAVLNMSHFTCPGSTTPHYIFGDSTSFETTCRELNLEILGRIPIEPEVSRRGDKGWPVVMSSSAASSDSSQLDEISTNRVGKSSSEALKAGEESRNAFLALGSRIWAKLNRPT